MRGPSWRQRWARRRWRREVARDRLSAALVLVGEAEAAVDLLPGQREPVTFWGRSRVLRRPEVPELVAGMIPHQERSGWAAGAQGVRELSARCAADLVVMAKFDLGDEIKLRAAYAEPRLTLAVQPPAGNGVDGMARVVRAHEVVSAHAPHLMAPVLAHGTLPGGTPYVVERWLEGEMLLSGKRLAPAVPEIVAGLAAVHRGHGVTWVRAAEQWPLFAGRWVKTCESGLVPDPLARWIGDLVARDGFVRRSWVHGDLAASNILQTPDGIVLIDWEHSREAPIMNDAAKLHLFTAEPDQTLATLLEGLAGDPEPGGYTPAEELALAHAQMLNHHPERRARLADHPRLPVYDKQVRKQLTRLTQVMDAAQHT